MADRKKIYDQLTELMRGDFFGYGKELADGNGGFERLLDEGTIAGRNGKRIPGEKDRDEKDRANMLGKRLESGEPIYIYKKGEEYPREVRMDKKSGRLLVSPKRLDELRPEEQIQKPRRPSLMDRYFDFVAKMFGGRWDACRKWDSYNNQQDALKNVREQKRIDRRRRFDPILNGTEKPEKQREQNAPEKAPEKAPETKTVQQNTPAQNAPEAEKQLSPEQRLLRNLEKEKQLQEQLRQLREENAKLEKELAGKDSVKNEKTEPTLTENEQQIKADKKLAKELQKEENKKYIEEQQQIKSDEELAKSLQEEEYKNQGTKPDEAQDLNDSFIEISPEKEKELQNTDIDQFLKDNAKDEPKPEEMAATEVQQVVDINAMPEEVQPPVEDINAISPDQWPQKESKEAQPPVEDINAIHWPEDEPKPEKKQEDPDEVKDLIRNLKLGSKMRELPENVEDNIRKLYSDAQRGRQVLGDALEGLGDEQITGGDAVSSIVAYEDVKFKINALRNMGDKKLMRDLSDKDFVPKLKEEIRNTPEVADAADNLHNKEYFEKNVLSADGAKKMRESYEEHHRAAVMKQSKEKPQEEKQAESEKKEPDEVDGLLSKLKGEDANKQLPENVEKNLRKLYTDAQKSRQVLTDALNDPKNEKLAGGNTISNIVAYENIKNNINVMEGDQELIDNISSKDFVRNWKGAARLSPDVVYASDYPHDKQFFEKNVLSEKGVEKMSRSMDRGVNKVILQQGLVKNGLGKERDLFWGPSNEAEKMAMRDEEREKMGPPQEDEIKVGKQPRKPVVKQGGKVNEVKPVRVTHHPLERNQPTNQPQPGGPAMM